MRDFLTQFLVPLLFLAIWALTSILNRDSQSLPQRNVRPGPRPLPEGPGAGGPRTVDPPAGHPAPRPAAASPEHWRGAGPPQAPAQSGARSAGLRPAPERLIEAEVYETEDEIFYVDPTTRRLIGSSSLPPSGGATPRPGARKEPVRKPSRGRRGEQRGARSRQGDSTTQRVLSEQVGHSMAQNRGTPLAPLTSTLTALTDGPLRDASSIAAVVTPSSSPPAVSIDDVQTMVADVPRLREMALMSELLQPPVSFRRAPRRW